MDPGAPRTRPGAAGARQLELEAGTARAVASRHEAAAAALAEVPGGVPPLDGGPAAPELLTILGLVLSTSGELSVVSALAAETVRAVERHLLGVDGVVAEAYLRIDPDRSDGPAPLVPPGTLDRVLPPGWSP
ncbi:hypothetical protein [Nocardioides lijunqiniae]|uniref:hypothetical protein n=1 Tax=Nocardioides lijunqiniae TaxID=2760832 RepID=UPI00187775E8|nr:hypothetical protein [Nocardioides lijunqiniae]